MLFRSILLGAGGLTRAYGAAAKLALDAAGTCRMGLWVTLEVPCTYALYERMLLTVAAAGGVVENSDFGADIVLTVALPTAGRKNFLEQVRELSAGGLEPLEGEESFRPGPRE